MYKLKMMGIPVNEPAFVYGDNIPVIHNTKSPESTLKKKINDIAYHFVRERVARNEWVITHISSLYNPADILTKNPCYYQERSASRSAYVLYVKLCPVVMVSPTMKFVPRIQVMVRSV